MTSTGQQRDYRHQKAGDQTEGTLQNQAQTTTSKTSNLNCPICGSAQEQIGGFAAIIFMTEMQSGWLCATMTV